MMLEEQDLSSTGLHQNEIEIIEPEETNVIEMINVTASWTNDYKNKTLSELNIKIKSGKLYAIIGSVGSGKSSVLQMLLGELPIYSGDALINGEISYGSQEAWLFSGTVRNNILFGLPYDKLRYQDTVKHCALLTDFQQLPHGDKTFIGERGSSLSGGQRARVSLARAVYKNASIYFLDDPLSAVDSHVGKHLFDECIGPNGYLARQRATRILVTHQVHFLLFFFLVLTSLVRCPLSYYATTIVSNNQI
jgi:ABC-type multidrug transport system fused ATPase/permease subunit